MTRLTEQLRRGGPTLCISLIDNDPALAKAVEEAGADGIKLHTNLVHGPTGKTTGSLEREVDSLRTILATVKIPVGIVPRGGPGTTAAEVAQLRDLGLDFIDLYGRNMNPSLLAVEGISKWVAATPDYDARMLSVLAARRDVDVVEAAFLVVDTFGSQLTIDDLVRLKIALDAITPSGKPLVLPTDRRLEIEDLPSLFELGVRNLLLGYAVTGSDPQAIVRSVEMFRKEIDALQI